MARRDAEARAAGVTVMPVWLPVRLLVPVSVAVSVWVPIKFTVTTRYRASCAR